MVQDLVELTNRLTDLANKYERQMVEAHSRVKVNHLRAYEEAERYLDWVKAEGGYDTILHFKLLMDNSQALETPATFEQLLSHLRQQFIHLALRGADDTWSGRGNDIRRTYYDGCRGALDYIYRTIWERD